MKQLTIILLFTLISFTLATSALAHSGCCSWHGGVRADGCGCNDGSPLSSTCAPYYTCTSPQQNTTSSDNTGNTNNTYTVPAYVVPTDTSTSIPTFIPTPTMTLTPTPKPVKKTIYRRNMKPNMPKQLPHKNWWQWLFGF